MPRRHTWQYSQHTHSDNACVTAAGEPPLMMAASALFAIKHAVEAARAEIGQDTFFTLSMALSLSFPSSLFVYLSVCLSVCRTDSVSQWVYVSVSLCLPLFFFVSFSLPSPRFSPLSRSYPPPPLSPHPSPSFSLDLSSSLCLFVDFFFSLKPRLTHHVHKVGNAPDDHFDGLVVRRSLREQESWSSSPDWATPTN